ncbi:MAG: lytic transglycosylase domain-containing protein [Bacteroidota bacterium]
MLEGLNETLSRIRELEARFGTFATDATDATEKPRASKQFSALYDLLEGASEKTGLDPSLLQAVVQAESGGNPDAVSPAGATGLMQLMPGTARGLGVDPTDPKQNVEGGARYLRQMLDRYGDLPKALAAYNAGPGAVDQHGGIPPYRETQHYVQKVLDLYRENQ